MRILGFVLANPALLSAVAGRRTPPEKFSTTLDGSPRSKVPLGSGNSAAHRKFRACMVCYLECLELHGIPLARNRKSAEGIRTPCRFDLQLTRDRRRHYFAVRVLRASG